MNVWEINQALIDTIDMNIDVETGEILEGANLKNAIDNLQMQLDTKIENIACYIKNLNSDAEQLKKEEDNLNNRRKSIENRSKSLVNYLNNFMTMNNKTKFETPKCKISYRKSTVVNIIDVNKIPKDYVLKKVDVNVDKNSLKDYLKTNKCEGAELITNNNIQIK